MATNSEGQQIMNSVRLAFLNLERRDIFWSVINDLKNEPYYNGNIFESANMAEQLNKNDDTYNRVISLGLSEGWIDEDYKDDEEVCGKWTEDKNELTDQDTGELCWCCENCGAYPNWGVDCE